jgi:uncharacterized ferritin-like protein (DUF455 family)
MEIRGFAERVLEATTLADKLAAPPDSCTDHDRGRPFGTPSLPGRPATLVPRHRGEPRARFPADARLIDEDQRSVLLHFFANHELLAVELMALALLKFPDAPASFRRGVLRTLRDEQEHTRWYVERMRATGLEFGDLPVSRMIWDQIAPMESPLDYVSRLSLTFEQANLDYARHYAKVLAEAGDSASAALLGRIYRDEIAHVGYGLKWLRRWKEETESDWDAFRRSLRFPLSPMRAKGLVPFNAEGRRRAGLDPEFIDQVRVFQQSTGRAPDVWLFNPAAEDQLAAAAAGRDWHPPHALDDLAADLEPAFFLAAAAPGDIALARRPPSLAHRAALLEFGLAFPEAAPLAAGRPVAGALAGRRLHAPRAWAAAGTEAAALAMAGDFHLTLAVTPSAWFAKSVAVEFWEAWAATGGPPAGPPPQLARTPAEAVATSTTLLAGGWPAVVIKSAFAAAGRGLQIRRTPPDPADPRLARALAAGPVVVEAWLPAVLDFSLHFDCMGTTAAFAGLVYQHTDAAGRWLSSTAPAKPAGGLPRDLSLAVSRLLAMDLPARLLPALECLLQQRPLHGPLGLDSLLWRDHDGSLHWRPVLDSNPRWTMGRVARELRRRLAPHRCLRLATAAPGAHLPAPVFRDGRLDSGAIPLTDPAAASTRVCFAEARLAPL